MGAVRRFRRSSASSAALRAASRVEIEKAVAHHALHLKGALPNQEDDGGMGGDRLHLGGRRSVSGPVTEKLQQPALRLFYPAVG